jgi:hypothetical protein
MFSLSRIEEFIMNILKGLQKVAVVSALALFGFSALPSHSAHAAGPYNADYDPGSCVGAAGTDCGTAVGHIGASVVGTLSINELRAINFGNVAVATPGTGGDSIELTDAGAIGTVVGTNDGLVALSGANANGGLGGAETGTAGNDGQHSGLYEISGYGEGGQTRVYLSFATTANEPLDCNGDAYYPDNKVTVEGPTAADYFYANAFTFAEDGSDVFGHYIDTTGGTDPIDVEVGATLLTDAAATYSVGKYVGEFNITASY